MFLFPDLHDRLYQVLGDIRQILGSSIVGGRPGQFDGFAIGVYVVHAVRDTYFERAKRILPLDASGWISAQLGWLHFNLRRALGEFEAEDVEVGQREVVIFLEQVRRIECSIEGWLDAWEEG